MSVPNNTFTAACIDTNSLSELREALNSPADLQSMKDWNLNESEYFADIRLAIAELTGE